MALCLFSAPQGSRWVAGLLGLLACQTPPTAHPPLAAQRQADVRYLAEQLAARHPVLYAHVTPAYWQQAVQQLTGQAPTYTDAQWRLGTQQLVALLQDGHTRVARSTSFRSYPVRFRWFPDGVYATLTYGAAAHAVGGLRLVRVGQQPVEEVLQQLSHFVSADNEVGRRTGAVRLLSQAEALAFARVAGLDSVHYEFASPTGQPLRVALACRVDSLWQALPAERPLIAGTLEPLYRRHLEEPFWYTALPAHRAVYVQYNNCRDMNRFLRFSWQVTRALQRDSAERFILDLRFNEGGNSRQFAPLRWWLAHSRFNRRGRLFVLIGRDTFSSGLRAACELKQQTQALLVGEATGGCPTQHCTEVKEFELPYSGLRIQVASRQTNYLPALGTAPTLEPDLPVPLTIAAYCHGQDPVLEAALTRESDR